MLRHHVFDPCCFHHIDHMMIKFDDCICIYGYPASVFSLCWRTIIIISIALSSTRKIDMFYLTSHINEMTRVSCNLMVWMSSSPIWCHHLLFINNNLPCWRSNSPFSWLLQLNPWVWPQSFPSMHNNIAQTVPIYPLRTGQTWATKFLE